MTKGALARLRGAEVDDIATRGRVRSGGRLDGVARVHPGGGVAQVQWSGDGWMEQMGIMRALKKGKSRASRVKIVTPSLPPGQDPEVSSGEDARGRAGILPTSLGSVSHPPASCWTRSRNRRGLCFIASKSDPSFPPLLFVITLGMAL